ncbi:MAG TPA: tRNA epoxyqueuosine(34) reductase QueG [Gemmatimonadaceae bacterium]|nr:tRNA epoxyqueuosine(34) reductase QueG [Gemmatimonadaceae bacterium]
MSSVQHPVDERVVAAPPGFASLVKAQAYGLGFDLAGITTLGPTETAAEYDRWIAEGRHGAMDYLARGAEKRHDTRLPFPGVVSAIVVAMQYGGREPSGPVARYARGDDYHDLMVDRLNDLHRWIDEQLGAHVAGKSYVDTGPILERELARRAGLGWQAKNTNLINPTLGSFFFIGALVIGLELEVDAPFDADRCGSCTRCMQACPTNAITAPRELDATRCISYLTIELKSEIPEALRPGMGGLLYGCDICQEVCPWNIRFSRELADDSPFKPREVLRGKDARTLARELLAMSQEEFSAAFRKSPMKRAKLRGLKRNAVVVLGNVGTSEDAAMLERALDDSEPLVREHAAWALAQIEASRK